jgi:hypothetical protein
MIPDRIRPEIDHVCSGVLVSLRDVLTVDHCQNYFQNHVPEVIVGNNNIRLGSRYYVSWWLSYNQWNEMKGTVPEFQSNDIAMLRVR